MRKKFTATLLALAFSLNSVGATATHADESANFDGSPMIPIGNTLVKPQTIERIIRSVISESLAGDVKNNRIKFISDPVTEVIQLPAPKGDLKAIFDVLGIKNKLSIEISPIQTVLTLPDSALNIQIKARGPGIFDVHANWSISSLTATTNNLALKVPAGIFDRPFAINSSPVKIGLRPGSPPISIDLAFTAELTEQGTKIHLNAVRTNVVSQHEPEFYAVLGKLTVGKELLSLQLQSNGQTMMADEEMIRAQFLQIEPALVNSIRGKIMRGLQEKIREASIRIGNEPPMKYSVNTDTVLAPLDIKPEIKKLFGSINADFLFSYIQSIKTMDLFSAQVASHICFDQKCIAAPIAPSPISASDLSAMTAQDDAGVVVYESILQNFFQSDEFQTRIHEYYKTTGGSAGVDLAKNAAQIYLDPAKNSIVAVLNLEIDIAKTIKANSSFGDRLRLWCGGFIERIFGVGRIVRIPIEINLKLNDLITDADGKSHLMITTSLPFSAPDAKGHITYSLPSIEHCPPALCPSNAQNIKAPVRNGFMKAVAKEIENLVPKSIDIPIGKPIEMKTLSFKPIGLRITENHGLLITAKMTTSTGDKK